MVWIPTDWSIIKQTGRKCVQWTTFTPDGLRLVVIRQQDGWSVVCGEGAGVQHELLDVALIEAVRNQVDFAGHSMRIDHAGWIRELAIQIHSDDHRPSGPSV